jgi:hypothetical protein
LGSETGIQIPGMVAKDAVKNVKLTLNFRSACRTNKYQKKERKKERKKELSKKDKKVSLLFTVGFQWDRMTIKPFLRKGVFSSV